MNDPSTRRTRTYILIVGLVLIGASMVTAQRLPIPSGTSKQPASNLIEAIDYTRSAYEIELLAVSTYEAALATPYLKGEAKALATRHYENHKRHTKMLLDLLDDLGGKYDDIKPVKKNYNWIESEQQILEHLIKAEQNSEKELSTDTKKTKLSKAHTVLERIRDDERAHLKSYEPYKK